jgi:hypothetical protein
MTVWTDDGKGNGFVVGLAVEITTLHDEAAKDGAPELLSARLRIWSG